MTTILGFGLDFKEITSEIDNQQEHKWDIVERIFEFEEHSGTSVPIPTSLRTQALQYTESSDKRLLHQQIIKMKKEGKSKGEIMKYFKLSKEEWQNLN